MHLFIRLVLLSFISFFVKINVSLGQENSTPFTSISLENQVEARSFAQRVLHYKLDLNKLKQPTRGNSSTLEFNLPTLSGEKLIVLNQSNLLANDYILLTQDGEEETNSHNQLFYRGKIKGDDESMVALTILNDEVHLMVYDRDGTYEVKKVYELKDTYSGIYSNEILNPEFIACQTDTGVEIGVKGVKSEQIQRNGSLDCVEIYLEIDFKSFQENDSSVVQTENWALAIMAQVALFYEDSGIPIKVSGIKVYSTSESDPYKIHGNTSDMLVAFRDSMQNQGFNGRLAHLLSGRGVGGGIAYLNVLCNSVYNVGVSGNLGPGGTSYSTYTWNINVIAHELGHNFGSQHTHDCVWNGDNTQIDDCGNKYWDNKNKPENIGACYDDMNVILPGSSATIMSYCHVVGGASINLNLGFHPQVRDKIYANYISTNCGGSEACIDVPPGNNRCDNAIRLTPVRNCTPIQFDNLYATDSESLPAISCLGITSVKDVWFEVKIPENGKLIIETKDVAGGLTDLVIQAYSGTCGTLIAEWCNENGGDGNHAKIEIDDISYANQELLIRVVEENDNEGIFGICTYSPELPCDDIVVDLIDFYTAMNGSSWINNSGWEDGATGNNCDYCGWNGITCDLSENIIGIDLSGNNLIGSLDNNLVNLSELTNLNLSNNSISGVIPEAAFNTTKLLTLDISENTFQGTFPVSIITAPKVINIKAAGNNFSGNLPAFNYASKLNYLDLGNNNFEGCFPGTYTRFNYSSQVNLLGNTALAYGGDFYGKESSYAGFDFDSDGFCFEIDDCNDYNNTIYNGAPEICDGLDNNCNGEADEGMNSGPNKWIGPISGGSWNDSLNWSMAHPPMGCEDTEVGMEGPAVNISNLSGQGYVDQYIKSICIGTGSEINLNEKFSMYIKHGFILNHGTLNVNAYFSFADLDSTKNGIVNTGIINVSEGKSLNIFNAGINGIYNKIGGEINNNGHITVDSNHPIYGNAGIINEAIINNFNYINIIGEIKNTELQLKDGSQLNNTGNIKIGGQSWGGGEN